MKKCLLALSLILILFTSCEKTTWPVLADDKYSFESTSTLSTGTNTAVTITQFHASNELSSTNLYMVDQPGVVAHTITYSGKNATITTTTQGIDRWKVVFTYGSGQVVNLDLVTDYRVK